MSPEQELLGEAELLECFPDLPLPPAAAWLALLARERAPGGRGAAAPRLRPTVSRLRVRPGRAGSRRPKPIRVVVPRTARPGEER